MKKRIWWLMLIPLAALLLVIFWPRANPAVLSSAELGKAAENLDSIRIEATFLPDSRSMRVHQELTLFSRADEPRDSLILRTYANAFQSADTSPLSTEADYALFYPEGFSMGALMLQSASVDGQPVLHRYLDDAKTVLSLPLSGSWQPGENISVTLEYSLILPKAASRYGAWDGMYVFGNAFALPAIWEDGAWRTDEYFPVGDPFYSQCFNFDVTVTAPENYLCAASAAPAEKSNTDGKTRWHIVAPACRDFALAFSAAYHVSTVKRGGLTVQAFTRDKSRGAEALRYALSALETYSGLYGPYPYQSFTVAEFSFPHAGMEYPGLILLSSDVLAAGGEMLERTVAHEAAHQWWYALVGSDPINHPWQDEALSEFSVLSYWKIRHGRADAESLFQREYLPSQQITMTATAGAPLSWFSSMSEYSILVYQRGAAMLWALDQMMDGGLNGFLHAYRDQFAFGIATRDDFMNALADYSGQDYQPLLIDYLDTLITP